MDLEIWVDAEALSVPLSNGEREVSISIGDLIEGILIN
jgi:hypothetical protein